MILAPTQHTLMELTLHSQTPVRASSWFSLAELHLPHLCSLSLRGNIFRPSVGAEPFVLQHAATLARLEVSDCFLPAPVDPPFFNFQSLSTTLARDEGSRPGPSGWDRIWDRFSAELTALVALDIDLWSVDRPDPGLPGKISSSSHITWLTRRRYSASA
ncbi:hypothetical protein H4582DRAFT_681352 [Lactarius indigo]|nr:hypothetical protein H4582DRAFT_681352 [Lactarius indigo]